MYVDESSGSDETVTSEDVTVTVNGQDYDVEKNLDLDDDGDVDAAMVDNGDGTGSVYIDDDADGDADSYVEVDEHGAVLAQARFDETSGDWVAVDPSAPAEPEASTTADTHTDTQTGAGGPMTADLPSGEIDVGPPTIDTDEDGVNDTAVTEDADGNTYYFTDADGDGEAEYVVVMESDGTTVALEHTGDGQWERTDTDATQTSGTSEPTDGGIGSDVNAAATATGTSMGSAGMPERIEGVVKIDPHTGQWLSPN